MKERTAAVFLRKEKQKENIHRDQNLNIMMHEDDCVV